VWDVEERREAALFECVSTLDAERAGLASESCKEKRSGAIRRGNVECGV
jgi:hypothetical protein